MSMEKDERIAFKRRIRAMRIVNLNVKEEKDKIREEYVGFYKSMHKNPKRFLGLTTQHHIELIANLIKRHNANSLLDYGSGKGMQYLNRRIHESWGGILPHCYDPGVFGIHKKPQQKFDGVICCDVLEHIPELLIEETILELSEFSEKFIYANIALSPAGKKLPNGENAHVTLKSEQWWWSHFDKFVHDKEVILSFSVHDDDGTG